MKEKGYQPSRGFQPTEGEPRNPPNCDSAVRKSNIEVNDLPVTLKNPAYVYIDLARDSDYSVIQKWRYVDGKKILISCEITRQEDIT